MNKLRQEKLFVLPNGSHLKYVIYLRGEQCGNQHKWKHDISTIFLETLSQSKEKHRLPNLGLWNSKTNQHVIAADFDTLPKGYDSYEVLYAYLVRLFSNNTGIVTRTLSGKVKCFFVVEIINASPGLVDLGSTDHTTMTKEIAVSVLAQTLPLNIFQAADKTNSALSKTFITQEMILALRSLKTLKPINHMPSVVLLQSITKAHLQLKRYTESIPDQLQTFFSKARLAAKEDFLRILLAKERTITGIDISTTYFAKQVSASHMTISSWLSELINRGWLICVDKYYHRDPKNPNKNQARTYLASGALKAFMETMEFGDSITLYTPRQLEDGRANAQIFKMSIGRSDREFERLFESLPGQDQSRRRHVDDILKKRKKLRHA